MNSRFVKSVKAYGTVWKLTWVGVLLLLGLTGQMMADDIPQAASTERVIYPKPVSAKDPRSIYMHSLLQAILEATKAKYGDYQLIESSDDLSYRDQEAMRQVLEKGYDDRLSLLWNPTTNTLEKRLNPVRIPVYKGLMGHRVMLVDQSLKKKITPGMSLEKLKKILYIGQGEGWADAEILKNAGFKVKTYPKFMDIFEGLKKGEINAIGRGVHEAIPEMARLGKRYPNMALEDYYIIHYPFPVYFFTSHTPKGLRLAKRLEEGFQSIIRNGSFELLFLSSFIGALDTSGFTNRTRYNIHNPLLPPKTPLSVQEYWLSNTVSKSQDELFLTPEEKMWIRNHPKIKVHNELNWAPLNFNKNGTPGGYSIELMNLLADKTGLEVEYVTGEWNDLYNQAINKKIDVMLNIVKTKEREPFFLFTPPYQKNKVAVYALKDNTAISSSAESLNGKKVAIVDGFFQEALLRKEYPLIQVVRTKNSEEALRAVCRKEVDATMGSYLVLSNLVNELLCYELEYKGEFATDQDSDLRIGVRNDYPLLHSILQKAIANVGSNEINQLRQKWIGSAIKKKVVPFTRDEREWIKSHPVIEVGGETDWAPFDFVDENGEYNGLSKDSLDLIAKMTGLEFQVTVGPSWNDLLGMLKSGELDLLPAIYHDDERAKLFHFTKPYLAISDYYITREEMPTIQNIESLFGKKVSVVKGFAVASWLKENYPQVNVVEFDSILEALRAVETEEVTAMINDNPSTTYVMEKNFITTLKINSIVKNRAPTLLHMAVKKGYEPLVSIIDKALGAITREEKKEISDRWMSHVGTEGRNIDYSEQELIWVSSKPTIRFAVDPNWPPIETIDEKTGRYEGMMADLLKKIEEISGVKFELVPTSKWSDSVELAKADQVDMLAAVSRTPERAKFFDFSSPTIELSDGVIMRSEADFITSLKDLAGLKVGVSDGTAVHTMLKEKYPELILVPIRGTRNGIKELEEKKIDAYVGNLEVIGYLIQQQGLFNLKVALRLEKKRLLHIALHKNNPPEALSVINKALAEITPEERDTIRQRWVGLKVTDSIDYTLLWKIGLGVLGVFLLGAYSNYRLKQLVDKKTADIQRQKEAIHRKNEELAAFNRNLEAMVEDRTAELVDEREFISSVMDSQMAMVVTTDDQHIRRVNRAFLDFFQMDDLDTFQSHYQCICDLFDADTQFLQKEMPDGKGWLQHVIKYPEKLHKAMIIWEGEKHVFSVTAKHFLFSGEGLYTATFTDITEMERIRQEVEELHKMTKDSIEYASLIQHSIIPRNAQFRHYFSDYFTIWHPRDVVGGDIYLFEELRDENECLLMVIDCTGHGVPGAFVSMLVKAIERQMVAQINNSDKEVHPAKLLSNFNRSMKHLLHQDHKDAISNAGFDGGILYYNKQQRLIRYAGAETPLFVLKENQTEVYKGDRHSVGYVKSDPNHIYKELELEAVPGMQIYLSTDGYLDQNGGEKGFPLGKKRFIQHLEMYHHESFADQQERLLYYLKEYQGDEKRNDDVTVIGLQVGES